MWTEWNSFSHPQTYTDGDSALRRLMESPVPIPEQPGANSKVFIMKPDLKTDRPLTAKTLMDDVLAASERVTERASFAEFRAHTCAPEVVTGKSKSEFLTSYQAAGRKSWTGSNDLIVCFNKNFKHIENAKINFPEELKPERPDFAYCPTHDQIQYETVICPAGAITGIHIDDYAVASTCIHVYGSKLWFAWPPTSENIRTYLQAACSETPIASIRDAMERLTGLEVLYIRQGQQPSWIMPPGTLHCVMTLSEGAGHTGFYYVRVEQLESVASTIDTVLRTIKLLDEEDARESVDEVRGTIERVWDEDLGGWKGLIKKMGSGRLKSTEQYRKILRWHNEQKERVAILGETFGVALQSDS